MSSVPKRQRIMFAFIIVLVLGTLYIHVFKKSGGGTVQVVGAKVSQGVRSTISPSRPKPIESTVIVGQRRKSTNKSNSSTGGGGSSSQPPLTGPYPGSGSVGVRDPFTASSATPAP